jgi:hypothetical protein
LFPVPEPLEPSVRIGWNEPPDRVGFATEYPQDQIAFEACEEFCGFGVDPPSIPALKLNRSYFLSLVGLKFTKNIVISVVFPFFFSIFLKNIIISTY